jgi:exonuclease III
MTLNINGLNSPIKRCRLVDWIKKQDPTICFLQEMHLTSKDTHGLKMKGWKMLFQASGRQKKGVAISMSTHIWQIRSQVKISEMR